MPSAPVEQAPQTDIAPLPELHAPPGAESIHFVLHNLIIDGATAYDAETLKTFYAPYVDKDISLLTIYQIAGAITQRYQQDGYVLARALIPQQEIENGTIHLQVVEGYVSDVQIANGSIPNYILADLIERIKAMHPLHMPTLERMLLTLNDLSGIQLKTAMLPITDGSAAPGAVMMQLSVQRTIAGGQFSIDDYGSRFIGPYQPTLALWANDQFLAFDKLSVRTLDSMPWHELHYGEIQYSVPLNADGTSVSILYNRARSWPGYTLSQDEIVSDSDTIRGEVSQAIVHSRDMQLSVTTGLEHKNISTNLPETRLSLDRLTVATGSVHFTNMDNWEGANKIDATLRQGLDILGVRPTGSLDLSRGQGRSDFTSVNATVSRLQTLEGPWQINLSANGQYAWSPLLASEQFGFGGQSFGRAYDPSEITGDDGLAGSAELRYNAIEWADYNVNIIPFTFYDVGRVWNLDRSGVITSGASAGGGFVITSATGIQITLTSAKPLTRPQDNPLTGNGKSPRWLFQLIYAF